MAEAKKQQYYVPSPRTTDICSVFHSIRLFDCPDGSPLRQARPGSIEWISKRDRNAQADDDNATKTTSQVKDRM